MSRKTVASQLRPHLMGKPSCSTFNSSFLALIWANNISGKIPWEVSPTPEHHGSAALQQPQ